MTTQLEIANSKLNRLKEEQDGIMKAIRKEKDLIPFGQPVIIGRRDIYKDLKRYYGKSIANSIEQDKQKKRIEMLEKVEEAVVKPVYDDLAEGATVNLVGCFTADSNDAIVITPVVLEVK